MSFKEEGRKSVLSGKTDDSDWSDIDSEDAEDDGDNNRYRLKIDLQEEDEAGQLDKSAAVENLAEKTNEPSTSSRKGGGKTKTKKSSTTPVPGTSGGSVKKKRLTRGPKLSTLTEVPTDVMTVSEAEKFHSRLETAAKQLGCNRTQVKTIIRRLVESEDLYNLIMEKAGEKPGKESAIKVEPRITRKLAKEVVETGGKLNWFLDKVSKTPSKVPEESVALLNVEFPDDESDQEYDPLKDPEALEALSDDDSVVTGTPTSSIATADVTTTPMSDSRLIDQSDPAIASTSENKVETFKRPLDAAKVARSLNFDQVSAANPSLSPRLTRSKASLKQVTIEELDTKYVPCDITPDMYDTDVDDYTLFLAETFGQPVVADDGEAETDPDPDFIYQESEELRDVHDEFENNRSTKISQKEVDELMQELFDAYELDQEEKKHGKRHNKRRDYPGEHENGTQRHQDQHGNFEVKQYQHQAVGRHEQPTSYDLNDDQRAILAQQMRQHIQLLTQIALLSSKDSRLEAVHNDCREMLSQLVSQSLLKPFSMFAQDNLFPSLNLLDSWQNSLAVPSEISRRQCSSKVSKLDMTSELMDFIGDSPAFIYPQLLPKTALQPDENSKSVIWSMYEDNLLAIGLECFAETSALQIPNFMQNAAKFIVQRDIVKNKTIEQVRVRLKNKRCARRKFKNGDAIDYWVQHKVAPKISFEQLQPYHPMTVVAPRHVSADELPSVWRQHFKIEQVVKKTSTPKVMSVGNTAPQLVTTSTQHSVHFSPNKMTFTIVESPSMPSFIMSPIKKANKLRPILAKPSTTTPTSVKFAKSPMTKERGRLLKKYSPTKKRTKLNFSSNELYGADIDKNQEPSTVRETAETIVVPVVPQEVFEPNQNPIVVTVSETSTQITILDAAMQECGIEGFESFESDPMQTEERKIVEYAEINHEDVNDEAIIREVNDAGKDLEVDGDVIADHDQAEFEPADPSASAATQTSSKRKTRRQLRDERDAEITLQLLEPEHPTEAAIRREKEALEIVMAAKETLSHEKMVIFCEKVVALVDNPVRAFCELHSICVGHPNLQEMLFDLMSPAEAMTLGPEVYYQHSLRCQMKSFFRKVRLHFENQPSTHTRILNEIQTMLWEPNAKLNDLKALAGKLFKSSQHLQDEFLSLFPSLPFPETMLPDSDLISISDDDDEDDPENSGAEHISIQVSEEEANYGGENCPCTCHAPATNTPHCIHCSLKFINGKIYSRGEGKILRRVCVFYPEEDAGPRTRSKTSGRRPKRMKPDATQNDANGDSIRT